MHFILVPLQVSKFWELHVANVTRKHTQVIVDMLFKHAFILELFGALVAWENPIAIDRNVRHQMSCLLYSTNTNLRTIKTAILVVFKLVSIGAYP